MESEFAVRHAVRRSLCTLYLQEEDCEQISRVTRENVWLPWVGAEAICSQVLREHPSSHWSRRAQQSGRGHYRTPQAVCPRAGPSPSLGLRICPCKAEGACPALELQNAPCPPPSSSLPTPYCVDAPLPGRGRLPAMRRTAPASPATVFGVLFTIGLICSQAENSFVSSDYKDGNSPTQKFMP